MGSRMNTQSHKKSADYDALFAEYLRVCNEALETNKDCFPYYCVMQEIEDRLKTHVVQVSIYDKDEHHPEALYDLIIKDQCLAVKPPHKKPHVKCPWRITRQFLEEVAANPQTYINNPAQLNWEWLNRCDVGV